MWLDWFETQKRNDNIIQTYNKVSSDIEAESMTSAEVFIHECQKFCNEH